MPQSTMAVDAVSRGNNPWVDGRQGVTCSGGQGLLNIAVGIVAILWPGLTVVAFVLLVAAWAIISGGLMMAAGFRMNISHGRWWLVLGGLCSLIYGALLIAMPLIGAVVLTWWMGAYALVFGISLIILSFQLRSRHRHAATPNTAGTPG
ncbi:uncharacterized membrane protein HdeD (DUF308 family) [Bradyrhizobium sp. USDA 4471]